MRFSHTARVQQHNNCSRLWVNASQIRALMEIAVITRQDQVPWLIRAAMLLRNNVVNIVIVIIHNLDGRSSLR